MDKKTKEIQERIAKEGFCNVFESLGHIEHITTKENAPKEKISTSNGEIKVDKTDYEKIKEKLRYEYNDNQRIRIWNTIIGTSFPNRYIHENSQSELLKCIPSKEEFFNCITKGSMFFDRASAKYFYSNTDYYFIIDVDEYQHITYLKTFKYLWEKVLHDIKDIPAYDEELLIKRIMSCPDSLDNFTI